MLFQVMLGCVRPTVKIKKHYILPACFHPFPGLRVLGDMTHLNYGSLLDHSLLPWGVPSQAPHQKYSVSSLWNACSGKLTSELVQWCSRSGLLCAIQEKSHIKSRDVPPATHRLQEICWVILWQGIVINQVIKLNWVIAWRKKELLVKLKIGVLFHVELNSQLSRGQGLAIPEFKTQQGAYRSWSFQPFSIQVLFPPPSSFTNDPSSLLPCDFPSYAGQEVYVLSVKTFALESNPLPQDVWNTDPSGCTEARISWPAAYTNPVG